MFLCGRFVHHTTVLLFLKKNRDKGRMSWPFIETNPINDAYRLKQTRRVNFLKFQLDWRWVWCCNCWAILIPECKCFFNWPPRQLNHTDFQMRFEEQGEHVLLRLTPTYLNEHWVCIPIQDSASRPLTVFFFPPLVSKINCISKSPPTAFYYCVSH